MKKWKTITNKINQNKAQYNLNIQKAKTSTLSPESVAKYEFVTGKTVLRSRKRFAGRNSYIHYIHHEVVSWKNTLAFQKNKHCKG